MEEAVEAAATVLHFVGDAIFDSKCGDVADDALAVEDAFLAEGVGRDASAALERAARRLKEASAEERLLAIVGLCDASAALERAVRAPIEALRGAAARLASSCRDYRETAEAIENLRPVMVEQRTVGRAAGWVWRWFRRKRGLGEPLLADDVESGLQDDVATAVDFVRGGVPEALRKVHAKVLDLAHEVVAAAAVARVPCVELELATAAFQKAGGSAAGMDALVKLGTAATTMKAAECRVLGALGDRVANVARTCGELKRFAEATTRVQRAAAELRERRVAGSWWSRVCSRRREPREEEPQDGNAAVQLGKGEERRSVMASMALSGSLTLITYLGPDTVAARVKLMSPTFQFWFHLALCVWWTIQAAGVPFSAYARSFLELWCAQIICRLGILGVNGFVIVFVYLALGIKSKFALFGLLIFAVIVHSLSFRAARLRGDLAK